MLRRLFLGTVFCALAGAICAQTNIVVKGYVDVEAPVYRIQISGAQEAVKLAKWAFSTHGSFKVVDANPQYSISLSESGDNMIGLSINGARPFAQVVQGDSYADAVARACDLAVLKILAIPGYFAGKLAFASDRTGNTEVYISDFLFTNIRQLTNDKSDSMLPHWSPDASKIIYTGYYRTKLMDLYEITLDPRSRRTFASYRGTNTGGEFSPDGRKVAMILTTTGNAEVWTCDASGKNARRLTKNDSVEASASWSPDGSHIVYTSDALGRPQLYIMSADGKGSTRIKTNISGYCSEPDWNPLHPNLIAYTCARGKGFQIAVHDLNTGKSEVITQSGSSSLPRWTNDGRHIIFTKNFGKSRKLYIVDYKNKKETLLHSAKLGNCGEADFIYTH